MYYDVQGARTYCYTAGKAFDPAQPSVLLIHGALGDHSVWAWQSRFLAHHGYNVLAVDLPGHGRSTGAVPKTIAQGADFVAALLDAAGVARAALVGHSWGSLIALEAAARLQQRTSRLVLVGTAHPMRVSPALIEAAQNAPQKALKMINVFSRSTLAPPSGAGFWVYDAAMALGRKMLAGNRQCNVLHSAFVACDSYTGGDAAARALACPVLFLLGARDQMTPPRAAQGLIDSARSSGQRVDVVQLPVGHNQMTEAPDATLDAVRKFLL